MYDPVPRPVYLNGRFLSQKLSGVQRFASEVTAALAEAGQLSSVLVPPGSGAFSADGDHRLGTLPRQTVGKGNGHLWEQTALPRAARSGLLLNLGNTGPILARRQIVVIHDCGWASVPSAYSAKFRFAYRAIQMGLVRRGAKIVTVSEFSKSEIVRHLGARPETIDVIPEGGEHILRIERDPTVLKDKGLESGRYVLAVGNLVAHKNLPALAPLAEKLSRRGYKLAIVGAHRDGIFQTQGGDDLPWDATYLGRLSDGALRMLYEHAACFVFPSRYEGFGLPPLEAMACGCPVVASDIPVLREICGNAALFADPDSPQDFIQQVERVIDDAAVADTLRAHGNARRALYNWRNAGLRLAEVVNALQHAPRRNDPHRSSMQTETAQ